MQQEAELVAVVQRTPGLSLTLLGEGLAYALAPGLYPDGDGDDLAGNVARDRANHQAWEDDGPGRFRMYGLALRPLLREALEEQQTLALFLPRARDVFLALRELEEAGAESRGPPRLLIAGPARDELRARMLDSRYQLWIQRFNHDPSSYAEYLPQLGPGDLFVVLVAGDDAERIPADYGWVSPLEAAELERRIRGGKTVEESHRPRGSYRVVVLAAPTVESLRELVARSTALDG
jgi:hypothetical protein